VLEDLQAQGVQISIDDFGTGYSSLSYFERLPANELKIDQSFVRDIKDNRGNQSIVKLVVDLAHAFDMQVVAEGVEDLETLRYLKTIGCDTVQGYYVARPMPQADICEWIAGFPGLDA
jgi:EAL domain-containing protein (putative c-di-GMP-specific phosphodiesterase class I)